MKINMKRTIYTAGLSAAVAAAALGLGGCGTGTQIPDTIKVQNMDADSNTITVIGKEEVKVVPVGDSGDVKYYRDENQVHYVPKRGLEEILL